MYFQTTIGANAKFAGVGLHSGTPVHLTVSPAASDSGIRFFITLPDSDGPVMVPARADRVTATAYATTLQQGDLTVHTVEHLLAALAGLGIDNADLHMDGPEVPIMDGSAAPFVHGLLKAGIVTLEAPRQVIRIRRPIRVEEGDKWIEVTPHEVPGTLVDYDIDFEHHAVGCQSVRFMLSPELFVGEVSAARTFGFANEVAAMRQVGLARGGSLENAVVIDDDGVMNPEGLRFEDEQVRHKVLDLIGDMALVGRPVWGRIGAYRSGHGLHTALAKAILDTPDAWELVDAAPHALQVAV